MAETNRISIFPLLVVSFIGTLGYSIVLPSLVYLVRELRGNEFIYGAVGATYSLFQLVGSPLLGKLSDRFGRKRLLFLSSLGSAAGWLLFLIALWLPMNELVHFTFGWTGAVVITLPLVCVFIARAVDGITAGDVSVANAYLADITTHDERKADFGKMGVAGNLGFVIGPVLAGILAGTALGLKLPVIVALATTILALVLIVWKLPESRKRQDPKAQNATITFFEALRLPQVPLLLAIYFVFFIAFSIFVAAMPLYAVETLKWSVAETGIFFSVLSIVIVATEGPLLSWLNKRVTAESLTIWGTLIVVFSYLALLVPNPLLAYSAAVLYALGNGLMWPSFLSILSDRAGEDNQGYLQGIGNSAGSLASIAGLFFGGALFAHLGGEVFLIPAALVLIVFAMAFGLRRKPSANMATYPLQ
jgi:MFS transporter, DHA1 family, tetracycline resistance protein